MLPFSKGYHEFNEVTCQLIRICKRGIFDKVLKYFDLSKYFSAMNYRALFYFI
jgi:hypothetical protein